MSQVSKNIFWLSISRVLALVLLFAAYTQLFRYLGPYSSGQYQFILSYVLIFAIISDFGIQQFITKKMSEDPENIKKYFQNFLGFEFLLSLCLYGALIGVAWLKGLSPEVFAGIAVAGLGMAANALTFPFLAVMTSRQDLRRVALINFINSLVNVFVIFAAVYFKKHIVFLASVQLIFGVVDLVLYRIFVRRHLPDPGVLESIKKLDLALVLGILKSAWPFVLLVGFSAVYNRIDVIIITQFLSYTQTGLYTAAYKFFDLLSFFPSLVSHVLFPVFAGLVAKQALGEVRVNLEKYLKLMIAAALPMAAGGAVLAKPLIVLVAGQDFASAAPVLAVLVWAIAILFIYIPLNSLVISQLTKNAAAVTGANVAVNVIGNLLLVPRYGIMAAAVMTVVSESIQGCFYFYFVRRRITRFDFGKNLAKPALAAGLMAAVLWQVRSYGLAVALPVGALVYALALFATGFVAKEDISLIKKLVAKSDAA